MRCIPRFHLNLSLTHIHKYLKGMTVDFLHLFHSLKDQNQQWIDLKYSKQQDAEDSSQQMHYLISVSRKIVSLFWKKIK